MGPRETGWSSPQGICSEYSRAVDKSSSQEFAGPWEI